jgi:hypothetical protein
VNKKRKFRKKIRKQIVVDKLEQSKPRLVEEKGDRPVDEVMVQGLLPVSGERLDGVASRLQAHQIRP